MPTDDTRVLLHQVRELLPRLWRDEHRYQKGGVMLGEFTPRGQQQGDLFAEVPADGGRLMTVIDQIRERGLGRLSFASQGLEPTAWDMKREHLSPRYTTCWQELPKAR